jgi:hypothetical protein
MVLKAKEKLYAQELCRLAVPFSLFGSLGVAGLVSPLRPFTV